MAQKSRIFIAMHYLELGGAERALIGLLNTLDPTRVDVDLFLYRHTGAFMPLVPSFVNILPERKGYNALEVPLAHAIKNGNWKIALARLKARFKQKQYQASLDAQQRNLDISIFQTIMQEVMPVLPDLHDLGEYDLAISFLQPHNVVASKVNARKKIAWIHTDYSTVHVNAEQELPVWNAMDYIASISAECTKGFVKTFPTLEKKIIEIENILSSHLIKQQAQEGTALEVTQGKGTHIVSVGRVCHAKNYDNIPAIAQALREKGLDFTWTVVGPGDHAAIDAELSARSVADCVKFIGARTNPYPYIAAADIYAQPSRYEGKSVTVREAQVLCRPVLITEYPTASSQVTDSIDGIICPMDNEGIANALYSLASDSTLKNNLSNYLKSHDYTNSNEVQKIYDILGI